MEVVESLRHAAHAEFGRGLLKVPPVVTSGVITSRRLSPLRDTGPVLA